MIIRQMDHNKDNKERIDYDMKKIRVLYRRYIPCRF